MFTFVRDVGVLGTPAGGDKMTASTACVNSIPHHHHRTSLPPTPPLSHSPIPPKFIDNNTEYLKNHTSTAIMFRRVAAAVPSQAGRVLSTVARPNIASPIRTAAPTLVSAGRRQYHEKDKSPLCTARLLRKWWRQNRLRRACFRALIFDTFL
jgi:hypothetical protein